MGVTNMDATRQTRRQAALERFERATELPLLILALAMIPLLLAPLVVSLSDTAEAAVMTADWFIWAAFAFEYVIRLALTDQRGRFVRRQWPDLLIIVLPFLRPLRIMRSARALRLLRLTRLAAVLAEVTGEGRRLLTRHKLHYALLVTMAMILGCALLVHAVEEGHGGPIDSVGDAIWWSITTVTTVGYGDMFPVTPAGRGIAAVLMATGIALFGVLTANLAALLVDHGSTDDTDDTIAARLDRIEAQLALLTRALTDDHETVR
jgi:voltage-gated potassium channel